MSNTERDWVQWGLMAMFSRRFLFFVTALMLLYITTSRFTNDWPAFFWSLIVLGGVVYLDG